MARDLINSFVNAKRLILISKLFKQLILALPSEDSKPEGHSSLPYQLIFYALEILI